MRDERVGEMQSNKPKLVLFMKTSSSRNNDASRLEIDGRRRRKWWWCVVVVERESSMIFHDHVLLNKIVQETRN